jgi:CRISPR type I-E-associated protein CasB/Cse2
MSIHSFVAEATRLSQHEDRGALANLRRLLGQRAGHSRAYRYIVPHVPQSGGNEDAPVVRDYLLVAGLFGLHPHHAGPVEDQPGVRRRNMGETLAMLSRGEDDQATERRFTRLLETHREQLEDHLRHTVHMVATAQPTIGIDYIQLFFDIRRWNEDARSVQFRWAQSYYRTRAAGV